MPVISLVVGQLRWMRRSWPPARLGSSPGRCRSCSPRNQRRGGISAQYSASAWSGLAQDDAAVEAAEAEAVAQRVPDLGVDGAFADVAQARVGRYAEARVRGQEALGQPDRRRHRL